MFSLPVVQLKVADIIEENLSEMLNTRVSVGRINMGLFNRLIVDDFEIFEPDGQRILSVGRVSGSIELFSLINGKINIGTAQLFGAKAVLYKETKDSPLNCQFIIDALSSDDDEPSSIDLSIGTLIIRNAAVKYDVLSEAMTEGVLNPNHISIKDFGANINLNELTTERLDVAINRLQFKELLSGLKVHDSNVELKADSNTVKVELFSMRLPHSQIFLEPFTLTTKTIEGTKYFSTTPVSAKANILLCDFAFLNSELGQFNKLLSCNLSVEGDSHRMVINELAVSTTDNSVVFKADGALDNVLDKNALNAKANVKELYVDVANNTQIIDAFVIDEMIHSIVMNIGSLMYSGSFNFNLSQGVTSDGNLHTDLGDLDYQLTLNDNKILDGIIDIDEFNVGALIDNENLGIGSAMIDMNVNLANVDAIPSGDVLCKLRHLEFKNHDYTDAAVELHYESSSLEAHVKVNDKDCLLDGNVSYHYSFAKQIDFDLVAEHINLLALNLLEPSKTDKTVSEIVSGKVAAHLNGHDLESMLGNISIEDIQWTSTDEQFNINSISICGEETDDSHRLYTISSGIVDGKIEGDIVLPQIVNSVFTQIGKHLNLLVKDVKPVMANYSYDFALNDSPILHKFFNEDFTLSKPVTLIGYVHSSDNEMALNLRGTKVKYNGTFYDDIDAELKSNEDGIDLNVTAKSYLPAKAFNDIETFSDYSVSAHAAHNKIRSVVNLEQNGRNKMKLNMHPTIELSDSIGSLLTKITLNNSHAVVNDTAWIIPESFVSVYNDEIVCKNVKAYSKDSNSAIAINGKASKNKNDSIVIQLTEMPVNYVTSVINFHSVEFGGMASGKVIANNLMGSGVPDFNAELRVSDFGLQGGSLGDANIHAHWDAQIGGVVVDGHMVDMFDIPDGFSGRRKAMSGITTVEGYIAPSTRGILLNINTMNTNVKFLEGWIGSIFDDVSGTVTGPLTLVQTADQFDLLGDIVPYINLKLSPTNMTYHLEKDTLKFQPELFNFKDITLSDKYGNTSKFDVKISHHRLGNFGYEVTSNLDGLCVYDENEFNSDKFYATLFAKGFFHLKGIGDDPLTIDANITPTRGSVFAYDASTPDAILGNSFIEFRDKEEVALERVKAQNALKVDAEEDSLEMVYNAKQRFHGDIRLNFNVALNPDCEVKLKMDNIEDGYMSTRGYANLNATWYNKGTFQLFGDYNIEMGSYRMYLHDLIFRDLALQHGSKVSFNGNPFDANIHLLCHHTLNSVPLVDLTSLSSGMKNNKVKVVCVVDITGKLDNMDFKFDMEMPNVSDEVRQLVRSLVSSEEEMNTQMLYLLGVGRFFPNQYARNNGNDNSSEQAMNSLLSSTLSGQINQMLSNVMGKESNWTFGSSLVTGERGWEDLDVEGTLSGKMFDDRLIINGNFGYRDNSLTNKSSFIGDFELKWRTSKKGNFFIKAYNQTNDRYFTKATLNTQGIGISWQHDFESLRNRIKEKKTEEK